MERILETFHEAYDEEDTRVPVKNIGPQVKKQSKRPFFSENLKYSGASFP